MNSKEENNDIPFVAIWMITYNHSKYISQAIEGVINQKTNFKIHLFIGEDCSTDNTREICLKYAQDYPDLITVISTETNNIVINCDNVWKAVITSSAKYIAHCEGDDYWTDYNKLQMQVDFMDANPIFSMCFTSVEVRNDMGIDQPTPYAELTKDILGIEDFIFTSKVFAPTATLLFRNILPYPLPKFYTDAISGDIALHLLIADKGIVKYMPLKTAVYRQHHGGITKSEEVILTGQDKLFNLYVNANAYFEYKYNKVFRKTLLEMSKTNLIYGSRNLRGMAKFQHVIKNYRHYFYYSENKNIKEILYHIILLSFPGFLKIKKKV